MWSCYWAKFYKTNDAVNSPFKYFKWHKCRCDKIRHDFGESCHSLIRSVSTILIKTGRSTRINRNTSDTPCTYNIDIFVINLHLCGKKNLSATRLNCGFEKIVLATRFSSNAKPINKTQILLSCASTSRSSGKLQSPNKKSNQILSISYWNTTRDERIENQIIRWLPTLTSNPEPLQTLNMDAWDAIFASRRPPDKPGNDACQICAP